MHNCHQLSLLLRILRRFKVKAPREIELEKLEQGFSIYFNGANAEASRKQPKISDHNSVTSTPAWRPARTAGMLLLLDYNRSRDTQSENSYIRAHHFLISALLLSFPSPYRTLASSHHSSAWSLHGMVLCPVSVNK